MNVACAAEVCGRFLWECDTSNKPFEWTGRHLLTASPPQAPCLPLRGSVRPTKALAADLKVEILIFILRHFDSEQPFY
jgi:hypothetical protein